MLAFFCRQLAQQRTNDSFSCYFAHTLSKELSAFLQSKVCRLVFPVCSLVLPVRAAMLVLPMHCSRPSCKHPYPGRPGCFCRALLCTLLDGCSSLCAGLCGSPAQGWCSAAAARWPGAVPTAICLTAQLGSPAAAAAAAELRGGGPRCQPGTRRDPGSEEDSWGQCWR